MSDSPFHSGLQRGARRSRWPLGMDVRHASRAKEVADASKPKSPASKQPATKEITIAGSFANPFKSAKDESDAMTRGSWEPTVDDFVAVGGRGTRVANSYLGLLGAILIDGDKVRGVGTVGRVNVFTHANPDLIAFAGSVKPLSVGADVLLEVKSGLTASTLDTLNAEGVTFEATVGKSKKTFTLEDVRKRFAPGAVIFLFACHSGVDVAFQQKIADTLQVKVKGFKEVIGYFPSFSGSPPTIDRVNIGVGAKRANAVKDFHKLDSLAQERTPKP